MSVTHPRNVPQDCKEPGSADPQSTPTSTKSVEQHEELDRKAQSHASMAPRLIGDFGRLRAHWDEAPYVTTDNGDISAVFSIDTVERLIHSPTLPVSAIRMIKDGIGIPSRQYSEQGEQRTSKSPALVNGKAVERQIAAGATLVVDDLKTYVPPMAALAHEISAETGYDICAVAFVTPTNSRGLKPHYDRESTIIRQVYGSKRWRVAEPIVRYPLSSNVTSQETRTVLDVVLAPGDCLYVPRGWIHVGDATDEASIHFTFGIRPYTWAASLRALFHEVLKEEELQSSLPYGFHRLEPDDLLELLARKAGVAATGLRDIVVSTQGRAALTSLSPADSVSRFHTSGTLVEALTRKDAPAREL